MPCRVHVSGIQMRLCFRNRRQRLYRLRYRLPRRIVFSGKLPYDYGQKAKFYIGFDCGHCGDGFDFDTAYEYGLIDAETRDRKEKEFSYFEDGGVLWLEYVEDQCRYIVDQLEGEGEWATELK